MRVYVHVRTYIRTCVHVRPPDCACSKSGYHIFLNVYVIYMYVVYFNALHEGGVTYIETSRQATQAPRQRSRIPIPALAKRGYGMAMTGLLIQPPLVCIALLSRKYCLKAECNLAAVLSTVQSAGRFCW